MRATFAVVGVLASAMLLVAACEFASVQTQRGAGQPCESAIQCLSGVCHDGACCDAEVTCSTGGAGGGGGFAAAVCDDDEACATGHCSDGVCCDAACDGACESCVAPGSEGICGPRDEGATGEPVCAPFLCNGADGECPSSCTSDAQCDDDLCLAGACRRVVDVDAGGRHACAVLSDGTVWCWGKGSQGQLGNGNEVESCVPVKVVTADGELQGGVQVQAGNEHSCVRLDDGTVWCWGLNSSSQLGIPAGGAWSMPVKAELPDNDPAVDLTTGRSHNCARLRSGELWCWGWNQYGPVGTGSGSNVVPRVISEIVAPVSAVGAGRYHTCAVADGVPYCWGHQGHGRLADGVDGGGKQDVPTPASAFAALDVVAVAGGGRHTCALTADAHVWCVGRDHEGQLGDGEEQAAAPYYQLDASEVLGPAAAGPLDGVEGITAHSDGTCAWGGGSAWCWGDCDHGELGTGCVAGLKPNAEQVKNLGTVTKVSAGHTDSNPNFVCAVADDRTWCWGSNSNCQCGQAEDDVELGLPAEVHWPQ